MRDGKKRSNPIILQFSAEEYIAQFHIVRDWGESGHLRTTCKQHGGRADHSNHRFCKEEKLALELQLSFL